MNSNELQPEPQSPDANYASVPLTEHLLALSALFAGTVLPFLGFGLIAERVWRHGGFPGDVGFLLLLHRWSTPQLDQFAITLSRVGDPRLLAMLGLMAAFAIFAFGARRQAAFVACSVMGSAVLNALTKALFRRERPALWPSPAPENDYGFPSGHAMLSAAVALTLICLLWTTPSRWPAICLGGGFAALVALSRLYLGVHFPSDVLAAWGATMFWTVGLHRILRKPPAN